MTFHRCLRALLFLALLSPFGADAVDPPPLLHPCTGLPITGPPYYNDHDPTKTRAVCLSPTVPWVDTNSAGMVAWRWCKQPAAETYYPQWAVLPWSDLAAQPALALELMAAGLSMNEAAIDTISGKYASMLKPLAAAENAAVWCPMWPKMDATRPRPAMTPSAWMVATNGLNTTRPTFPVTAGVRSRVANGVAAVRADCNITGAVIEPISAGATSSFTFGSALGAKPGSVTMCVRRR